MTWLTDQPWLPFAFWALLVGGSWGSLGYSWLRRRKRRGDDDQ